ncbi:MAG: hypothetical protein KDB63_00340 [Nocardioidaceae bacterium]|nr:hypothetical protein [Nocardioidaceae bacterium]
MSLVFQIVVTTVVTCLAVVLLLVAVIGDHNHAAWFAFAFGIVAHASFRDVRMRWREAHQFTGYGDGEDNVRAIR